MSASAPNKPGASSAMEVIVDKAELLTELSLTQGVVERRTTVPILGSFRFEAANGKLLITGTDLEISLRTFCTAKVVKPGSCTVPARKLYEYVRLLREGEITIKLLDNHWVQIRSGRSNTKMIGLAPESFPPLPLFPGDSAVRLPAAVLRTMITKTVFAVSQEESRYTLKGALLLIKAGSVSMVATDGHRLALIETVNSTVAAKEDIRALIPRKALLEIHSLLNSGGAVEVAFARDESTLFFAVGPRLFTSRQLTGSFPNYEAVLPRDLNRSVKIPAAQFSQAVLRVSQFADGRSNAIRLRMEKNLLRVCSSSPDAGESEDSIETRYDGDPVVMGFNSHYLLDFMRVAGSGNVTFHFKAADAAGEFRTDPTSDSAGEYKHRYIVMPMRA